MRQYTFLLMLFGLLFTFQAKAQYQLDSTTLDSTEIITGLDIPWEMVWGEDDHIWVTERYGRVSRINPETGVQDVILDHSGDVYQGSESGMLGMALHPDFADTPYVYIVYTYLDGFSIEERLSRFEYDGTSLINETPLLEDIPGNTTHIGSRLLILPDRTMLMTTGDAQDQPASQDLSEITGKTLRMHLDGSAPADNPFPGSLLWSWGHRNAQGLVRAPNGIIYCSEHGPTTDDEFHIIEKGRNYGWPDVHGFCDSPPEMAFCADSNVVEPLVAWTPTLAPSDLVYYDHPSIPEWQGSVLMAVLKNKHIRQFTLSASGEQVESETEWFNQEFGRIRDLLQAPNGDLYVATNGQSWSNTNPFTHSIIRLTNPNYQPPPPDTTSIQPINSDRISLYPNPTRDKIRISIDLYDTFDLSVFDANGRLVHQVIEADNSSAIEIDCNSWVPGMYTVEVLGEKQVARKSFTKF